ncbi:hypothetical protein F5883DRAFT_567349 [Diaporthe sp. PMI_573]|nr:hypothetical protein F5883DRAFT_567349 [Diaporthaceae sp. PMI_573]
MSSCSKLVFRTTLLFSIASVCFRVKPASPLLSVSPSNVGRWHQCCSAVMHCKTVLGRPFISRCGTTRLVLHLVY